MSFPRHQDSGELGINRSPCWKQHFLRPFYSFDKLGLRRLRHHRLQPIQAPIAAVHVGRVLGRKMKASLRQPSGPLLRDPHVLHRFRRVFRKQQPMLLQVEDSGTHAARFVLSEMRDSLCVGSPLAKEIENFAGNWFPRDGQSLGEIMQKQPTVPPVQEQAPGPSPSDRLLPHLFRLMQYSCKTASKSGHR